MKKLKLIAVFALFVSMTSCAVLKKDCGCPHFGKLHTDHSVNDKA